MIKGRERILRATGSPSVRVAATKPTAAKPRAVSPQSGKGPVAPALSRPQPRVAQPHMRAGVTKPVTSPPERKPPVAPPVYRPQPEPKVLQRKNSLASKPDTAHSRLVLSLQRRSE